MRTEEQIKERLAELNLELEDCKEWVSKAEQRYQKDREWWGAEADNGEMRAAQDALHNATVQYNTLSWVLDYKTI